MSTKSVNPQNPYVFDPDFFTNQTHLIYNDTVYGYAHRIINTTFPLLGLLSSLLVIYLIFRQTPNYFRHASQILLINTLVDLVYAACDLFGPTRFQASNTAFLFSLTGPASWFGYETQCYTFCFKKIVQSLGFLILPAQHMLRLHILINNSAPPFLYTLFYFVSCLAISIWTFGIATDGYCWFENPNRFDYGTTWYPEHKIPVLIVGPYDYAPTLFFRSVFWFTLTTSYALATLFALLIMYKLHRLSNLMSPQTLSLQRQVGRALFVQNLIPLVSVIVPNLIPRIFVYFNTPVGYFYDLNASTTTPYPLLSSLSSVIFIAPYRQFCKHFLYSLFFKREDNSVVVLNVHYTNNSKLSTQVRSINVNVA